MFPDFIKHYSMIRSILRDVFLYGCFSKNDLENKSGKSSRKISYEMRRIKQYIESDFIKVDKDGSNKLLNLSYDNIANTKNFLVNTYLSKSFTKTDIKLYYLILLALNLDDNPKTFLEIEDILIESGSISYDEISSKTIERKIKEMSESMEIISYRKRGRSKEYFISDDILKELTLEELEKFYYVVDLYKNIVIPNISGYYSLDTLKDYIRFERGMNIVDKDFFQYDYLHFQPIIEEELIVKVMKAIENRNTIIIKNNSRQSKYDDEVLKPIKLRIDVECGRVYVISFCNETCVLARLDRKDDVEVTKNKFDYDKYLKKYNDSMEKSFSSVPNNGEACDIVQLELTINPVEEEYLLEKIKGELNRASFNKVSDESYLIDIEVNDAWEMIPWIRRYGGNVKVISPKWLKDKLNKDWEDMLEAYGVIS